MKLLILLVSLFISVISDAQISALQVIEKSISYHDPEEKLLRGTLTLNLIETRPNGPDRFTEVELDQKTANYMIVSQREDGPKVHMEKRGEEIRLLLDGSEDLSDEEIKKYRLSEERLIFMKNYYRYLWMAPIILQDPGTIVHDEVRSRDFFGTKSLEVKITYEPGIGDDIWYFYFDPTSYAMVGYRFYHDEAANDGEYILISGEVVSNGVKIPKSRKWYTHQEDRFLGEDILEVFLIE